MTHKYPPIPPLPPATERFRAAWKRTWTIVWPVMRQVLGWVFIVLGILGIVLPILQGVLFLMIGIVLVGRRNVVIRWSSVRFKQFLRRWAALETPVIGWLGRAALRAQQECLRQRRKLHWWYVERRRSKQIEQNATTHQREHRVVDE